MAIISISPAALLGANTFTGAQALPAGTAAALALTFGGEQTGLYRAGVSDLRVSLSGGLSHILQSATFILAGGGYFGADNATSGSGYNIRVRAGTVTTAANAGAGTLTLGGQVGTGAGAGGSVVIQSPTTLATGTTAQTAVTRLTISQGAVTTDAWTMTLADACTLTGSSTVGVKIGAASTEKWGYWGAPPVVQQLGGVTLTNNVTVGGTTNQIDNIVAASVDTSAAELVATRNAIYQLSRKLKLVTDALRTEGLLATTDA